MRRARTVRRAPARAHPARRLGLSHPRRRSDSRPSIAAGGARRRGAELTEGAVDPTIGYALVVNGYDADFSSVAPQGAALRLVAKRVPGWQAIHFNAAARTVLIPRGVVIDLGATGKALAADLAA